MYVCACAGLHVCVCAGRVCVFVCVFVCVCVYVIYTYDMIGYML